MTPFVVTLKYRKENPVGEDTAVLHYPPQGLMFLLAKVYEAVGEGDGDPLSIHIDFPREEGVIGHILRKRR